MFCREAILRPMNMSAVQQTAMFIRPRTILPILMSIYSTLAILFARAPKPKFSDAALRLIASKPPLKMWVAKKA